MRASFPGTCLRTQNQGSKPAQANNTPAVRIAGRPALLTCWALLFIGVVQAAWAGDRIILGTETWRKADGPHRVDGNITVAPGGRLIVEAGTVVYFRADYR